MKILNKPFSVGVLCTIPFLLACMVDGKNVANLDIVLDKQTGKLKRQLPSLHARDGSLLRRDPKRLPLDLEDLFEGKLDKRSERETDRQEFFINHGQEGNADQGEPSDPICLDSRIPSMNEISIFGSYLRDDITMSRIIEDPLEDVIIFAPSDSAIESLPLKPWQFPADVSDIESGAEDEEAVDKLVSSNIRHFVNSHIATGTSIDKARSMKKCMGSSVVLRSFAFEGDENSGDIMLKKKRGKYYVASSLDKKFQKVKRVERAQNGLILVIDATLISP